MKNHPHFLARSLQLATFLPIATLLATLSAFSQSSGQKTFASSREAVDAFVQAVRDSNVDSLRSILGEGADAIISSGDQVADKKARQQFLTRYDAKHDLAETAPHEVTLNVGVDDWPLPIPLVDKNGKWYFDGVAGKEEILYRRIGHNELAALNVCKGVVAAQKDYAAESHDGQPAGTYAARIVSEPGKQNGLYWEVKDGGPQSPAGPLLAQASSEGYDTTGNRVPYHGYYYRMLKTTKGFAFVAYPAQYRISGVMTFVADQTGAIYEKDLGEKTDDLVQHSEEKDFHPASGWVRVK